MTLRCADADGIEFAVFYTKLHNRLLRPLMAKDRQRAIGRTSDYEQGYANAELGDGLPDWHGLWHRRS